MDNFIGTITYVLRAEGSKSEGYVSFLTIDSAESIESIESTESIDLDEIQDSKDTTLNEEKMSDICEDTPSRTIYQLYRTGVYAVNDVFFEPYNNLRVEVEGEIMMEKWIDVKSIKLIKID